MKCFKRIWHYIFLIVFLALLLYGFLDYFHKSTQIIPFQILQGELDNNILPPKNKVSIVGQIKTEGDEFVVGQKITISAKIYFDENIYEKIKAEMKKNHIPFFIPNSLNPEVLDRDLSTDIQEAGRIQDLYFKTGTLDIVRFDDENQTIIVNGEVVFNKEGNVSFTTKENLTYFDGRYVYFISGGGASNLNPIARLLIDYGISDINVFIAPRHVKHQIETNKLIRLLTLISVDLTLLIIFITIYHKR